MNLISTGNQIGQGIAFTRLLFSIMFSLCLCSVGSVIFTMKPRNENDTPKRTGLIFMIVGLCSVLISYIVYSVTKSFRGAGTAYTAYSAYDLLSHNRN